MEGDSRSNKVSLLRKYDIPIEHLTYEYIGQCSDKKELERIIRILRSGEEGMYPDLIKFSEEKLQKVYPDSRVLRTETPALTKEAFTSEEWKAIENELLSWENEMKVMDKTLEFEKQRLDVIGNKDLPEVRKVNQTETKDIKTDNAKVKIKTNQKNERIRSGDYASWDKFDVDKELLKLDIEEEKKAEEKAKLKREVEKKQKEVEQKTIEPVNVNINSGSYSLPEQQVLANQAKDRGNECFKSGDFENALKYYGVSLRLYSTANAYNNRAMTYLKLKQYQNALDDCNRVLKLEPDNVKALHRRATAYQNLPSVPKNSELALRDLNKIVSLEPNNKVAQADLQALKKKLNIEETGRKFRMFIEETSKDYAKEAQNVSYRNYRDCTVPLEKLPLTYYGPSTSTFECEPHSITHRMLTGPMFSGQIVCKCNSNSTRQNPLCQRCGELMSRPKPPVKKSANKKDNNVKNELVKQNVLKQENPEKSKFEINKKNEKSKETELKDEILLQSLQTANKLKADLDHFINSKFQNNKRPKQNQNNNDDKGVIITEIFDDEVKDEVSEKSNEIVQNCNSNDLDESKSKIEEINDDVNDKDNEKEEKNFQNQNNKSIIENNKINEVSNEAKAEEININQSLPSSSSQTNSNHKKSKSKKKKSKERSELRDLRYRLPEPVKVVQASKYLNPTSVESKINGESPKESDKEIKIECTGRFKKFVPNRNCLSSGLKSKSGISTANHGVNIKENEEKIRHEENQEGNKENIESNNSNNNENGGNIESRAVYESIESAYEFMRKWESFKKTDETYVKRAEIMRRIRPSDLGKVVGNKLDSEMLKCMLECLEKHFLENDAKTVVEYLKQLPRVPRFGIVSLFLDCNEKKLLERLVDSAEEKGFKIDREIKKALTIA